MRSSEIYFLRIEGELSEDLSSTAKIWKLENVCLSTESKQSSRYGATSHTGITIATLGDEFTGDNAVFDKNPSDISREKARTGRKL